MVPKLHVIGARDSRKDSRWCYTHGIIHRSGALRLVTVTKDESGKWACEAKSWLSWSTALLASAAVQADLAKLSAAVRACKIQTCMCAPPAQAAMVSRPEAQEAAVPVPVAAAGDSGAGEPTTRSVADDRGRAQAAAQSTSKSALKTATGAVRQGAQKLGMSESHPATHRSLGVITRTACMRFACHAMDHAIVPACA